MTTWRHYCDDATLDWLLEPNLPPVRYLTLRQLLDRPADDPQAAAARRQAMRTPPVTSILRHWRRGGRWAGERGYYTHKYKSTHWQLLLLAELQADGADPRIAEACERMLRDTARQPTDVLPCFHGNLIGYQAAFGRADDERLRARVAELAERGVSGGVTRLAPRRQPSPAPGDGRWTGPWWCTVNDGLPCAWGAARALWGLARLPAGERTAEVDAAIHSAVHCGRAVHAARGGRCGPRARAGLPAGGRMAAGAARAARPLAGAQSISGPHVGTDGAKGQR